MERVECFGLDIDDCLYTVEVAVAECSVAAEYKILVGCIESRFVDILFLVDDRAYLQPVDSTLR